MDNNNKNNDSKKFDGLKKQVKSNIGKEISDDEVKKNTDNIPVKNPFIRKNAMAISALISLVGCFLPFLNITFSSGEVNRQTKLVGCIKSSIPGRIYISALIVFSVPIIIFIMNYIPVLKKHRRKIALICPAVGLLCEIITYNNESELLNGPGMTPSLGIGGIAIAAGFILTIIVGLFVYYGVKKDDFKK